MECTPEDSQAENDVADGDVFTRQKVAALRGADGETGEIIVFSGVKAWHFSGFAADQRRAGLKAAGGDAGDDGGADLGVELAGRVIVQEKQRLCALHDQIVDAHCDEVDPDRVVNAALDGDFHLGADAVIGGDEDGVGESGGLEVEQPAETADFRVCAAPPRRAHQRLDQIDHPRAGVDVDARLRIGQSRRLLAVLRHG